MPKSIIQHQSGPIVWSKVVPGSVAGAILGPGCVIAKGAVIGAATRLYANVAIYHGVLVGERCVIQSGAVLGSDGFGNAKEKDRWIRIPSTRHFEDWR